MGLVQDLYAAHKDNQTFLHTRFGLGEDVLKPYKETLDRWLWPNVLRNQDTSVAKAKQAISSYRKAVGEPAGLAELMVSFCESAAGFCNDVGYQDEGYFDALVNMFEQALKVTRQLSVGDRDALIAGWTACAPSATILDMASAMKWTTCLQNTSAPNRPSQPVHSCPDMLRSLAENSRWRGADDQARHAMGRPSAHTRYFRCSPTGCS